SDSRGGSGRKSEGRSRVFPLQGGPHRRGKGRAFCFYYKENMELLEKMGCRLISFSPVSDSEFPKDLDGLILGGGYPELYARQLSENRGMRDMIRDSVRSG